MAQCPSVPVDRDEQRQDKLLGVGSQGLGGLVERGAEAKRDVSCSTETEVSEIPHSPDADGEEKRRAVPERERPWGTEPAEELARAKPTLPLRARPLTMSGVADLVTAE
jgi:hypothetical protein